MYGEELIGEWGEPPEGGVLPVDERVFINQIRANCRLELPVLKLSPEHDRIMVMVCGGPTAKIYLEDIRKKRADDKYRIFCSNKTHDWLIENGVVPHYQFMIDPKEGKWRDVQKPHKDVTYLIGISSHPKVFEVLKGYNVIRVASLSGTMVDGVSDVNILSAFFDKEEYAMLEGGTMAGLRAMTLANIMGYRTVEFYGFDSCFFNNDESGKPIFYSYPKERGENILECKCDDGTIYQSTPVFASQAREFIKWKHRLEWIKFVIHGDSLTARINILDDLKRPPHENLITDYMLKMNQKMFKKEVSTNENDVSREFGSSGHKYAGEVAILAGQIVRKFGPVTLLDYGCGLGTFAKVFPPIKDIEIKEYDPCVDEKSQRPEPADIMVCTDVLEHIEQECLENVLDDIQSLTKKVGYIAICLSPAMKNYSDGRNCHLTQLPFDIWFAKLKKRFLVTEGKARKNSRGHDMAIFIVQAKEIR